MRTLVITGGSKGIGAATVDRFVDDGFKVINLSRTRGHNESAIHIALDLADAASIQDISDHLLEALGESSEICFVHSAGLLYNDTVESVSAQEFARVLQVNVIAAAQLVQILLPRMGEGSSILYVGSTLGEKAVRGAASYATSKHALIGLMRATCQDTAGKGVHTVCVCPGFTDTQMLREHVGNDTAILEAIASGVTFGRLIDPGEIADMLLFCASNPVINGAVLHANLGQVET